jgi:hypothetical protein
MIGPLLFGFFALVHGFLALAALSLASELLFPALCLFIVETVTSFDNGATLLGSRLGTGEKAESLSRKRFLLHATCIGFLLPVYSGIGAEVAFTGLGETLANGICWLLAIAIGVYGYLYQYRGLKPLMPVNNLGCLRYAQSCTEHTRWPGYEYTDEQLKARGSPPIASIVTTLVGLLVAVLIGWLGSFWIPLIVTALMLSAGGFSQRGWGPLVTSGLEVIFSTGLLYSLWYAASAA